MDFINNTKFPTLTHRAALENDIIAMAVMCRVTYDVNDDGNLSIANEQEWELHEESWVHEEYGPMDTDNIFQKGGVDIMIFGSARAPKGQSITESEVSVSLNGKTLHSIKIYGNRVWKSFMGILSKSNPEPFTEIPLTPNNAFGGVTSWDELEINYPLNPTGKGYYYSKDQAIGNPLPNIEDHNKLISKWNDWLEPAGVSFFSNMSLKAKYNITMNEDNTAIKKLNNKFFNSAYPNLIIDKIEKKDTIKIKGVTENQIFSFIIPETTLEVKVLVGKKQLTQQMKIDQVGILPDKNQVFLSYRFPFKYTLNPMEKRITTLKQL